MTVNINTDIDTQIKQLDELLKRIELIDTSKMITFISISDFARLRNCSMATAQRIFRQKDFPSERISESKKLLKFGALRNWYMTKHDKNE